MSTTYKKFTKDGNKVQVESAIRDSNGVRIDTHYAKQDGDYSKTGLKAYLADNLDSKVAKNDENAYLFRTAGGSLEIGEYCKVNHITGGCIGFNQLVQNGNFESTNGWSAYNGTMSISNNVATLTATANGTATLYSNYRYQNGRVYLFISQAKATEGKTLYISGITKNATLTANGNWQEISVINLATSDGSGYPRIGLKSAEIGDTCEVKNVQLFDLIAMFGSPIANYIYSLETQTAGAGVAWFKRYFTKDYYPYTPIGSFVNVMTKGKKYVGFNQFNKATVTTNSKINNSGEVISGNYNVSTLIEVQPDTVYYFKDIVNWNLTGGIAWYDASGNFISITGITASSGNVASGTRTSPTNAKYVRIVTPSIDTCNLNFHYDGERDGEHEPYKTHTVDLDTNWNSIGIPQIDENGNLYFIGNRYNYDGSVDEIYKETTLTSNMIVEPGVSYTNVKYYAISLPSDGLRAWAKQALLEKYGASISINSGYDNANNIGKFLHSGAINEWWVGFAVGTTIEQAQEALSGLTFIYPLATPTQSTATPFPQVQKVDNWGTEQFLAPDNDTRVCEVPVGHDTDYPLDCKSKIEIAPDLPENDGVYVCKVESGVASYTGLATWLGANGYVNQISADAIKENIGGALRHQLATMNNVSFNKTAIIDLSSLSWSYNSNYQIFNANVSSLGLNVDNTKVNGICARYNTVKGTEFSASPDKTMSVGTTYISSTLGIVAKDSSFNGDATAFTNSLKGILLAYEKA